MARLIARLLRRIKAEIGGDQEFLVDVGAGEGFALEGIMGRQSAVLAIDFRHDKLLAARERLHTIHVVRADIGMIPLSDRSADIVVCTEVLEHLTNPLIAVAELARITAGRCIVSVPWEPYFRLGNLARLNNLARLGNDPEHIQAFNPRRLRATLGSAFETVEIQGCWPWLIGAASHR